MKTKQTVFVCGWIPADREEKLAGLLAPFDCSFELCDPAEGEEPPVLLRNNSFVEPFEQVTRLLNLPVYGGIDPNPYMAPFFILFFGIMMADIGYGAVMLLGALFFLKKAKPRGTVRQIATIMLYSSVPTIVCGVLFGSLFGDAVPQITQFYANHKISLKPLLFDPLTNPVPMLLLSLGLGVFQIFFGLGIKAYTLIKEGKWLDAFFDVGFWYAVLTGIILMIAGFSWAQYLLIAGLAGLLLTQGRSQKNIVMKLVRGLASLYDITGYFSDVLSYSRLMALGLAGSVIASVVNLLGTLPGRGVVGFIAFILIFLLGHAFNMALNLLGTYVHTSRLQFVEFYSKFFDGGGRDFEPFAAETKYTDIVMEE